MDLGIFKSFEGKVIDVGRTGWAYVFKASPDHSDPYENIKGRYTSSSTISADGTPGISHYGYLTKTMQKKIRVPTEEEKKEVISIIFKMTIYPMDRS